MAETPIPTVICSTLTKSGSKVALEALATGAVAVVAKPRLGMKQFLEDSRRELLQTLKAAARTRPRGLPAAAPAPVAARSAAQGGAPGLHALAIILTGMGNDGARGMKLLHDRGARTIAQNEETCVVFGMPMEAIRLGVVDDVLPISQVAPTILRFDQRG